MKTWQLVDDLSWPSRSGWWFQYVSIRYNQMFVLYFYTQILSMCIRTSINAYVCKHIAYVITYIYWDYWGYIQLDRFVSIFRLVYICVLLWFFKPIWKHWVASHQPEIKWFGVLQGLDTLLFSLWVPNVIWQPHAGRTWAMNPSGHNYDWRAAPNSPTWLRYSELYLTLWEKMCWALNVYVNIHIPPFILTYLFTSMSHRFMHTIAI